MFKKPEVCIIPVAGLSTRNLPSTKALHKGFLTLHGKPIIQYAIDSCKEIGIKEVIFIYSDQSCKNLFEKHFSPYPWLENHLREKGKLDLLKVVQDIIPEGMKFSFAEQKEPKGNGHAVLMAKELVGDRDFIVMWADDVYVNVHGGKGMLAQLMDVYQQYGGMVDHVQVFPDEEIVRYGVLEGAVQEGNVVHATGKIEKPSKDKIPSNFGSLGPYILPNAIMDILPEVQKGNNGEINLADAMGLAAKRGIKLTGAICDIERFDCGTNRELEKSNLRLSLLEDPELRDYCCKVLKVCAA